MNSRELPNEIFESIFIFMIKHKQYSDLNELKKIQRFSAIIYSLKKHYMMHLYNRMNERAFSAFSEYPTILNKRKQFLSKYTPNDNFESIYDLFEFCKTRSIGTLAASYIFPLRLVANNLDYVDKNKYGKLNKFRYNMNMLCDILDNIVIIGSNIRTVVITLNGCKAFRYYYLAASIIKITPLKEGIWSEFSPGSHGTNYIDVYSECIDSIYMNGSFISDRRLLMNREVDINFVSTEFDTNYKFGEYRKNHLIYMNQRCYPKFVVLTL